MHPKYIYIYDHIQIRDITGYSIHTHVCNTAMPLCIYCFQGNITTGAPDIIQRGISLTASFLIRWTNSSYCTSSWKGQVTSHVETNQWLDLQDLILDPFWVASQEFAKNRSNRFLGFGTPIGVFELHLHDMKLTSPACVKMRMFLEVQGFRLHSTLKDLK